MTEIFLASVLASSNWHWARQDDRIKSFLWCVGGRGGFKAKQGIEKKLDEDGETEE